MRMFGSHLDRLFSIFLWYGAGGLFDAHGRPNENVSKLTTSGARVGKINLPYSIITASIHQTP